jgi:hypothetical protein
MNPTPFRFRSAGGTTSAGSLNPVPALALALAAATALLPLSACDRGSDDRVAAGMADEGEPAPLDPNRIAIPPAVRSNLGISFVTVEPRRIERTLRVPGQFEYLPTARREYRTMVPGRVELLVDQFDRVDVGTPLYRIDSPAWRELQGSLTDAEASIDRLTTRLASFIPLREAHHNHERRLEDTIAIRREQVAQLEQLAEAGGGRRTELMEARGVVSTAEAELAEVLEKEAELGADEAEIASDLAAARTRREFLLDTAASWLDMPVTELTAEVDSDRGLLPQWRTIDTITVSAEDGGVVETLGLTNGSWADEKTTVLAAVRPDRLRFHARGLQSDLGALRDGLEARIVPPTPTATGRAIPLQDTMTGRLAVGLAGHAGDRTIDLFVHPDALTDWARPGVAAQLEIVTDQTARAELSIPMAAVQQDGLTSVIFRRDPDAPNEAIRIEADLGADDGRWVAVRSGLRMGDEVVLDGSFQLMLATTGTIQKGGHFHSDGTFHAEDH